MKWVASLWIWRLMQSKLGVGVESQQLSYIDCRSSKGSRNNPGCSILIILSCMMWCLVTIVKVPQFLEMVRRARWKLA